MATFPLGSAGREGGGGGGEEVKGEREVVLW